MLLKEERTYLEAQFKDFLEEVQNHLGISQLAILREIELIVALYIENQKANLGLLNE